MYLNDFSSLEDIKKSFWDSWPDEITCKDELEGVDVLFANYGGGSYDGEAFVLFRKGGKLYEVNGSHCSCYGLEGQWEPEETTKEALLHRLEKGELGDGYDSSTKFAGELKLVIATL